MKIPTRKYENPLIWGNDRDVAYYGGPLNTGPPQLPKNHNKQKGRQVFLRLVQLAIN